MDITTHLTLYCCGTGYNRDNRDVVANLNRITNSLHAIFDGPGSGGFVPFMGHNPGGGSTIGGLVAGVGVDSNVDAAIDEIKRRYTTNRMVVNLCGWSRGAVTCFKIANALATSTESTRLGRRLSDIPLNIFAIDPVPGGTFVNNHMWQGIQTTPNLRTCQVVLSQHDRRSVFAPVYPQYKPGMDIDLMAGDHSTLVEPSGDRKEASELVHDWAKRFLRSHGTHFTDPRLLMDLEILARYARLAARFEEYAAAAKGSGFKLFGGGAWSGERILKDVQGTQIGSIRPVKPVFFLNEHHRETFRKSFPLLITELDKPAKQAFREDLVGWIKEYNRLATLEPETAGMLAAYVKLCLGTLTQ